LQDIERSRQRECPIYRGDVGQRRPSYAEKDPGDKPRCHWWYLTMINIAGFSCTSIQQSRMHSRGENDYDTQIAAKPLDFIN
jgi:hypothetical protein